MPAPDLDQLGSTLRALREARGTSQEDLAHEADITTTALSRIERGKTNPGWSTVIRILTALKTSLTELEAATERTSA